MLRATCSMLSSSNSVARGAPRDQDDLARISVDVRADQGHAILLALLLDAVHEGLERIPRDGPARLGR